MVFGRKKWYGYLKYLLERIWTKTIIVAAVEVLRNVTSYFETSYLQKIKKKD